MNGKYRINKHRLKGRLTVLLVFFVTCFSVLFGRLFVLQVLKYDEYRQKAEDNVQSKTPLKAERGKIYDRNMVEIATSVTSWRVFISPRDIKDETTAEVIASGLSEILDVSYETVLSGAKNNKTRDRTVKKKASAEEKDRVIAFALEKGLTGVVHTEADTSRYYPLGSLAAHVIGFMGTDSGLSGIESYYDSYLTGTDGYYITSKNASGETLPDSYDAYVEATASLQTTATPSTIRWSTGT